MIAETRRPLDHQSLLSAHYLFRGLSADVLDRLAHLSLTVRLKAGETLFRKGDEGDALYGIISGHIRIASTAINGREMVLTIMQTGDVFGEIAILDGGTRSADALAMDDVVLLMLRRRDFLPFLDKEPSLAVHLLKIVCERLRASSQRIEDMAFLDLPARLAKILLAMDAQTNSQTTSAVKLSQTELGNLLGASRESINKILQKWRKAGLIELARSHVRVRDRTGLAESAFADSET